MKETVKWGIIAAGGIARRRTLPAMSDCNNAEIIAIMDSNQEILQSIQSEYHIPKVYYGEDELLKDPEIDAVYVASPVCFHKEQARKVIAAGKHLLLEKPLGLTLAEAEDIHRFCENAPQKIGVGMVMKHHGGHQLIRQWVQDGLLGDIITCRAQLTCWFPDMDHNWRQYLATAGGGALMDMGIHCIDLLRLLLKDDPAYVYGDIATKTFHYEVEDSADCLIRMKKGTTCFVDAHFNVPDVASKNVLELYGTRGSVIASGTIGQEASGEILLTVSDQSSGYDSAQKRGEEAGCQRVTYDKANIYAKQITAFSDAIRHGAQVSTTTWDALQTMRTVDALYRSSQEKKAINLHFGGGKI